MTPQPPRPEPAHLVDHFNDLTAEAGRVVALVREWDDDDSGTTDQSEFRIALPVLDLVVSREEADALFDWLLAESRRLAHNAYVERYHEYKRAQKEWIETPLAERGPKPTAPPPLPEPTAEIDHWVLFRMLAGREDGVDVASREAEARERLATYASESRHATAEGSAFWSRDVDGRAQNRHALRKRDGASKGIRPVAEVPPAPGSNG